MMRTRTTALLFVICSSCSITHDVDGLSNEPTDASAGKGGTASGGGGAGALGGTGAAAGSGGSGNVSGGVGATSGGGSGGGTGACGNQGEPCCTTGSQCFSTANVCLGGTCTECGDETEPCCDNPKCSVATLLCDEANYCRTCPAPGVGNCGGLPDHVCDANEQCVACGKSGQPCCNPSFGDQCPGNPVCCSGSSGAGECLSCADFTTCICKVCCVKCLGSANQYQFNAQPGGECWNKALNQCGSGNVDWADFRQSCG